MTLDENNREVNMSGSLADEDCKEFEVGAEQSKDVLANLYGSRGRCDGWMDGMDGMVDGGEVEVGMFIGKG